MPSVSAEIKRVLKAKDRGIASGTDAMLAVLKDLHGQVAGELGKAALGTWDAYHLRRTLDAIEFAIAEYTAKSKTEISGLLDQAWAAGKELVDAPLAAAGEVYINYHLSTATLDILKEYSNDYLQNMFQDAWYQVKGEINLGILGSKTPQDIAKAIGRSIDGGRFKKIARRAETITKTEMGTVFSQAAQLRMEQAAEYVEGLEKKWRHAGHPHEARPTHLAADGQHVPVNQPFFVGGIKMMFPRDPAAPLSQILNCGCDHVPYHADWA
jgi:hypothetical protein